MEDQTNDKKIRVLAIETSCDETAIALLSISNGAQRIRVLKHLVSSQIPIHQRYGGVVPEVAARSHVPETVSLLTDAVGEKGLEAFDALAVTRGPGLATALSVGLEAARTLAMLSNKPIIGVNHLEGHLASAWLNAKNRRAWEFPLLALIVSGGHTELVLMRDFCDYEIVGQTRDDAAGEAFDKSAKLMGLPYPGGPQIARLAKMGNPKAFDFPRPMLNDGSFNFSFSGLKTSVRYTWDKIKQNESDVNKLEIVKKNMAASVQEAIVDILVQKTVRAAQYYKIKGVLLVGGVSANAVLRSRLGRRLKKALPGVHYFPSDRAYITDNAAMIAGAGYWHLMRGETHDWHTMELDPEWNLE